MVCFVTGHGFSRLQPLGSADEEDGIENVTSTMLAGGE